MIDPHKHSANQPNDSLKATLKKRRTETLQRTVDANRRNAVDRGTSTRNNPPAPPPQPANVKTTTTVAPSRQTQSTPKSSASNPVRKPWLIGLGIVLVIVVIGVSVVVSTSNHPVHTITVLTVPPQPAISANQLVGANQVIDQFKKVGLPISGQRNIPVSSNDWKASQEILFDMNQDGETGLFILLSYPDQQTLDVAKVSSDPRFKGWQVLTASNVSLLISPQTSPKLRAQIGSYLTQSLVAPDRSSATSDTSQS